MPAMQVQKVGTVTTYDAAPHGALLLAGGQRGLSLWIKAIYTEGMDRLVSVAPGFQIFQPPALRDKALLDITAYTRLVPSPKVEDTLPRIPNIDLLGGLLLLGKDATWLGVHTEQEPGMSQTHYLDLATGQLVPRFDHDHFIAVRGWRIVSTISPHTEIELFQHTFEK